jgi:hypothetical protein
MVEASDFVLVFSKRKAINTLLPYAIFLEQGGQQGMIDIILCAARVSDSSSYNCGKFMWRRVVLYISRLFEQRSPTSLDRIIIIISPYVPWEGASNKRVAVSRWAAAALATPYTDEVGQNVVDALFQIAHIDFLRPHIPIEIWRWLKRRPSLPPIYSGLRFAMHVDTVAYVRTLGEADVLKSLFLLGWSDKCSIDRVNISEVVSSVRGDFVGIEMEQHREDLIQRLGHIIGLLDQGQNSPFKIEAKAQYTKLKEILVTTRGRPSPPVRLPS